MVKYTKEVLEPAVKNSVSYAGVLRYLGLKHAGGTQSHIKKQIIKFGLSTTHFTGMGHNKGKSTCNKRHWSKILILRPSGSHKENIKALRRAMIESRITYCCNTCRINKWNQKMITLQVHHLDGNSLNNQRENVIFLCPNCHSQTENYSGKANKAGVS